MVFLWLATHLHLYLYVHVKLLFILLLPFQSYSIKLCLRFYLKHTNNNNYARTGGYEMVNKQRPIAKKADHKVDKRKV